MQLSPQFIPLNGVLFLPNLSLIVNCVLRIPEPPGSYIVRTIEITSPGCSEPVGLTTALVISGPSSSGVPFAMGTRTEDTTKNTTLNKPNLVTRFTVVLLTK